MSGEAADGIPGSCPTPIQLGRAGWDILHSSAAVYPYKPTEVQREAMHSFILGWSQLYACSWCAYHMRQYVKAHPPQVEDKLSVTRYVCELHNEVNERLHKPVYDCDPMNVLRRWHPGYPDKMEDRPSIEEKLAAEKRLAEERERSRKLQEEHEARLSGGGSQGGHRRGDPAQWRDSATTEERGEAGSDTASAAPRAPSRWWFFGGSAFGAERSPSGRRGAGSRPPASPPPPREGGGRGDGAGADDAARPRGAKVADSETNVDAVLARLRGCQVYCPDDEEILGNKTVSR